MSEIKVFNTRRQYTAQGQVIAYKIDKELGVTFMLDHSRGINGTIPIAFEETFVDSFGDEQTFDVAKYVLKEYDDFNYNGDPYMPVEVEKELHEAVKAYYVENGL